MPLEQQSAVQRTSWSQVQHIEAALTTEGFFATAGTVTLLPLPCVCTTYSKEWVRHDVQCVCAGKSPTSLATEMIFRPEIILGLE